MIYAKSLRIAAFFVLTISAVDAQVANGWVSHWNGPSNQAISSTSAPQGNWDLIWSHPQSGNLPIVLARGGTAIYQMTSSPGPAGQGQIVPTYKAVSIATGLTQWIHVGRPGYGPIPGCIVGGRVFFGSSAVGYGVTNSPCAIECLDLASGALQWTWTTGAPGTAGAPGWMSALQAVEDVSGGRVVATVATMSTCGGGYNHRLVVLDAGFVGSSSAPYVAATGPWVAGSSPGSAQVYTPAAPAVMLPASGSALTASNIIYQQQTLYDCSGDLWKSFQVISAPITGATAAWSSSLSNSPPPGSCHGTRAPVVLGGGAAFTMDTDGRLRAFSATTGAPLWSSVVVIPGSASATYENLTPTVLGQLVLVASANPSGPAGLANSIQAFDINTGASVWSVSFAAVPTSPVLVGLSHVVFAVQEKVFAVDTAGQVLGPLHTEPCAGTCPSISSITPLGSHVIIVANGQVLCYVPGSHCYGLPPALPADILGLVGSGSLRAGNVITMRTSGASVGSSVLFGLAAAPANVSGFAGLPGTLLVDPAAVIAIVPLTSNASGVADLIATVPAGLTGAMMFGQSVASSPSVLGGLAFSNGVAATFP